MIFWTRSGEPLEKTKRDLEQNWMNPCTRSSDPPPDETRSEPSDRTGQIPEWSQEGYLRQNQASPWTSSSELQRSAHYRETMQQISRARRDEFTVRNAFPVSAISQLR